MSNEVTGWECVRCSVTHPSNPQECWNCGHEVFEPLSDEQLAAKSDGTDAPEVIDFDEQSPTAGSNEIGASSPDVALDGSIANDSSQESNESIVDRLKRLVGLSD